MGSAPEVVKDIIEQYQIESGSDCDITHGWVAEEALAHLLEERAEVVLGDDESDEQRDVKLIILTTWLHFYLASIDETCCGSENDYICSHAFDAFTGYDIIAYDGDAMFRDVEASVADNALDSSMMFAELASIGIA